MEIFAKRLRELRLEAGLSARQVGAGIGVAHSTIVRGGARKWYARRFGFNSVSEIF